MSVDERDLRMALVAFEDAATWCEEMADLMDRWIATARSGQRIPDDDLQSAANEVRETRRYLASNRQEIRRIKERTGLS